MNVLHGRTSSRPVWALLGATGLSGTGNAVVAVAVPWLVLQRTGSPALAGLVAAAALGPLVLSALLGGALVDRWGRRTTSVRADLLSAAAVAAIPLVDAAFGLSTVVLVLLVAAGAVFDGPGMAAREALRPDVAFRSGWSLEQVNARGEAVDGLSALAGPALAGGLIALSGPVGALWSTVALFLVAAAVTRCGVPAAYIRTASRQVPEPYWASVAVGLRTVWGDRTLRATGLLGMALVLFLVPLEAVVLPTWFASSGDVGGLAAVLAGFAVGGLAGALAQPRLVARWGRRPVLLGGLAALALGLAGFALLPSSGWLLVLSAATGCVAGPLGPVLAVVMQERTPQELRGRVIGALTSLSLAAAPVGLLLVGPLLAATDVRTTFLVIAAGCLLATGYAWCEPGLRQLGTPAMVSAA